MDIPEIAHEHYFKVPVCKTKHFIIKFEEHIHGTFIHCDVFHWNKNVKQQILDVWEKLTALHGGPIHALHDKNDRKHEKFLNFFGFKKSIDLPEEKRTMDME